ncbi:tetratricopeptide repeat protein, partial [Moraxella sp. HMSC061H09]
MLTKFTALAMGVLLSVSAMAVDMATADDMATLTRQAQSGDAVAQVDLAREYYQQGNHAKAVEWITKAAGQGHAGAQYGLGWMYRQGQGVRQDYQKAVEWTTKAVGQGHAGAQYNLGVMYAQG